MAAILMDIKFGSKRCVPGAIFYLNEGENMAHLTAVQAVREARAKPKCAYCGSQQSKKSNCVNCGAGK